MKLVKLVKVNNLEYNNNRDPKVFRRQVGESFRVQALLGGEGSAKAKLVIDGTTVSESDVSMPGTFECAVKAEAAGTRQGVLTVEGNGETFTRDIRFDVLDGPAW